MFEVPAGSPLAEALSAAWAADEREDWREMDAQYLRAVALADDHSAELRLEIAIQHVCALRAADDSLTSLARSNGYEREYGPELRMMLTGAETRLSVGDFAGIDDDLAAIHRLGDPGGAVEQALLHRLEGLAAAHHREFAKATMLLERSRDEYKDLGELDAVQILTDDLAAVAAGRGEQPDGGSPLTRAEVLRVAGRYEEALAEVERSLAEELDPTRRFVHLEAMVRLLRLLREDERADKLMPELYKAAWASAVPTENLKAAHRLDRNRPEPLLLTGFEQVRWLIADGQLAAAEQLLLSVDPPADPADWHLAAAELSMAVREAVAEQESAKRTRLAEQAITHCVKCLAVRDSSEGVRIAAHRLLGHAHKAVSRTDAAVEAWRKAHQLEESIAQRQPTDAYRLRMLREARSEFDEYISWAGEQGSGELVVLAMEAAKGAALRIDGVTRELPALGDRAGAQRWICEAVRGLPKSQAIWLLYAAPDAVHHVFLRRIRSRVDISCQKVELASRDQLLETIDELAACWRRGGARQLAKSPETFDRLRAEIADQLGIADLTPLPEHVNRIAVVAGGQLAELPFALLPRPGTTGTLLGRDYAVSALPSLSLREPLRRRSRRQRGTRWRRTLVLHGPGSVYGELTPATRLAGRTLLLGAAATGEALREKLATKQYRQVRLDCHGKFGDAAAAAGLLLAPGEPWGWLSAAELSAMNLSGTGTLLLGACESGMVERIGRDEQDGFVRAGLLAGASAVLAARWDAHDAVGAGIADLFERNLRHHPRDLALFHAQRAVGGHESYWGAWTVHGATDHQTRRWPLLRRLHRALAVRQWGK